MVKRAKKQTASMHTKVIVVKAPNGYALTKSESSENRKAQTDAVELYETPKLLAERLPALGVDDKGVTDIDGQLKSSDTAVVEL